MGKLKEQKVEIYVDRFEKAVYESESRLDRTLWFQLGDCTPDAASLKNKKLLMEAFNVKKTGLIKVPIRVKLSKTCTGKRSRYNNFMFVEFEDVKSIANVTSLMNKRKIPALQQFKAYKAGTNTFVQILRSKKRN